MSSKFAKVAALVGSGVLSGGSFYVSAFAIPALLSPYRPNAKKQDGQAVLSANTLQVQWKYVYDTGKIFFPFLGLGVSALYVYLGFNAPSDSRKLYWAAAASTIGMVPYTFAFMMGNIKKIEAEVKEDDEENAARLRSEIVKWSRLNLARTALLFTGFLLSTWATLDV
ncbi:hypothetical protein CVT26_005675 [Gymnopilus dilepis]|uniref:DUF1772 domain-containing protein n=1 Tax=Gymnopilus dilepis TaxID=231916 RepID=A0A409XZY4_9AGAR|nr:hypothetical protein CVT26_005675 [Gymnopilus dilepis]